MITCTAVRFDIDDPGGRYDGLDAGESRFCEAPAATLVTIAGADHPKGLRAGSGATSYNLDRAPRCDDCARVDRRVVERFYCAGWTFEAEPIA